MVSRARNHASKTQVNEVVHVSYHGPSIGPVTEGTKKQDQTVNVADEEHTLKVEMTVYFVWRHLKQNVSY